MPAGEEGPVRLIAGARKVEELSQKIHDCNNSEKTDKEVQTDDYPAWANYYSYYYSSYGDASNTAPCEEVDGSQEGQPAEVTAEPTAYTQEPSNALSSAAYTQEASSALSSAAYTLKPSSVFSSDYIGGEEKTNYAEAVPEQESTSLAESLRATAEAALSQTGFTYDENTGLYYDHSTGFYYDSESQLYYDPSTGIYYYCDVESGRYQFHSRVDLQSYTDTSTQHSKEKKAKKKRPEPASAQGEEQVEELSQKIHDCNNSEKTDKEVQTDDYPAWANYYSYYYSSYGDASNTAPCEEVDGSQEGQPAEVTAEPTAYTQEPSNALSSAAYTQEASSALSSAAYTLKPSSVFSSDYIGGEEKTNYAEAVPEQESTSLAESLRATAEAALSQTGFTYDENTGLYYNHSTGFYYDSESQLYYDPSTGIYYYCDVESGRYQFHSRVDLQSYTDTSTHHSKEKKAKKKRPEPASAQGEEQVQNLAENMASLRISAYGCHSPTQDTEPIWPPCIRVIVVRSPVLQKGSLFIITAVKSATIGREKDMQHTIRIPELGVSKFHAEVYFDHNLQSYVLVDQGSQNGTVINGNQILQPKTVCEPYVLHHGDEVKFGETVLSFHVHPGSDTCDGCEPGQVRAHLRLNQKEEDSAGPVLNKAEKEMLRRRGLKKMREKYGLQGVDYEDNKALKNPKYKDRASRRRLVVGSEGSFQREEAPASVHVEIGDSNKGRKMLEKMGWKKGEGLGKTGDGMRDPIHLQLHKKKAGLGTHNPTSVEDIQSPSKNKKNWEKARERYAENFQDVKKPDAKKATSWVKSTQGP
ncbi:angiogenic factor with G patch and FHA domains 1 isoform X2 [Hyperolius riggenbachi]|uniref:angiogenic factor with G patch and FHA domains 1 isoform X2 n=1 Tax=Hyperolius riggenbachi TaxID=752182 RepID=UPI0035A27A92